MGAPTVGTMPTVGTVPTARWYGRGLPWIGAGPLVLVWWCVDGLARRRHMMDETTNVSLHAEGGHFGTQLEPPSTFEAQNYQMTGTRLDGTCRLKNELVLYSPCTGTVQYQVVRGTSFIRV